MFPSPGAPSPLPPSSPVCYASRSPKEAQRSPASRRRLSQGHFRFCKGQKKVSDAELSPPALIQTNPSHERSPVISCLSSSSIISLAPGLTPCILNPALILQCPPSSPSLIRPLLTFLRPFPRTQASIPEYDLFPSYPSASATGEPHARDLTCFPGCDACRARKVRCARENPEDPRQACKHCIALGIPCTYEYQPKKRGPPNLYAMPFPSGFSRPLMTRAISGICGASKKPPPLPLLPSSMSRNRTRNSPCLQSRTRVSHRVPLRPISCLPAFHRTLLYSWILR